MLRVFRMRLKFYLIGILISFFFIALANAEINTETTIKQAPTAMAGVALPTPEQNTTQVASTSPELIKTAITQAAPVSATAVVTHSKPYLADFSQINSGDTAWMLAATALVLLMTIPGLVLFYSGMIRKKNVLSTALQSFAICCLVTIIWVIIGYSIAFTPGSNPFLGGFDRLMLEGLSYIKSTSQVSISHIAPTIPESVFVIGPARA